MTILLASTHLHIKFTECNSYKASMIPTAINFMFSYKFLLKISFKLLFLILSIVVHSDKL